MLRSLNDLDNFTLHAQDGDIGAVEDLCFDDARWTVRYLVANTGSWLHGRKVLISPTSVQAVDWYGKTVSVALTCDQVKNSPGTETHNPVSRQHEEELAGYYGWPPYWTLDPSGYQPLTMITMPATWQEEARKRLADRIPGDPHLRSAREVRGYHIEARDGPVGHLSDFMLDDQTWSIAFIVVDAGNWLHKRLVLLKPEWIQSIDWEVRHVDVALDREAIKTSPEFAPLHPISAEYAEQLVEHYHGTR